ncbi:MAG: NAD-dependent epimerase/dehydratase family protein [Chloroflexota bacterium]
MKLLVLGGTRFVGLRLVRYLISQGHDVTILNRGRTQAQLPPGVKRLFADRRDTEAFHKALAGLAFEAVFDITGYEVRNLVPPAEVFSGRVAHYVFISTCGVYQAGDAAPVTEEAPRVNKQTAGVGAYEINKAECEDFLLGRSRESGFPVTILRCPYIYGPENWMHDREFSYFVRLAQGRDILVPGDGGTRLHLVHVDDVARAQLAVIGNREAVGQAFNIAGPETVSFDGYIDAVAGAMGIAARKVHVPLEAMRRLEKPVFPYPWEQGVGYSIQKAEDVIGFHPVYSIIEGIKQTYLWWKENVGLAGTRFEPGKLGYNVDLAYEEKVLLQYRR